uniref:NADH-ubiquinone oxidoreductase chain 6 n=1 Tax=Macrophiothrix sp. TaxID=3135532 RepID=A0AAU6PWW2_9ECHI
MMAFCLLFLCGGFIIVFSGSPFYSVFGVLIVALGHASVLAYLGFPFFSLLITIIYAGGMLVVFLFSTILSADRFPVFSAKYFGLVLLGGWFLALPLLFSAFSFSASNTFVASPLKRVLSSLYGDWAIGLYLVGVALLMALVGVLALGFEGGEKSLRRL